jgi:hypothetical protein
MKLSANSFLLVVIAIWASWTPSSGQEPVEFPNPREIEFPDGYQIIDDQGNLIKTVPGPARANIQAYFDRGESRYFLSDWSYQRFHEKGIRPNVIVAFKRPKILSSPSFSAGGDEEGASIRGVTEDGSPWAYEFLANSDSVINERLWRDDDRELLYSNEEWIVTGQFIRINPGRGRHELSFYDAKNHEMSYRISVPNYVLRVDWSPNRKQFFLITSKGVENAMMVKWPDDIAQALVVVDPGKQKMERIRIIETNPAGEDWNYFASLGPTKWNGDTIELNFPGNGLRPERNPVFRSPGFRDIRVAVKISEEVIAGAREVHDRSGLNYVGLNRFSDDAFANPALEASIATVQATSHSGVHLVRATPEGGVLDINLTTLRSRYYRLSHEIVKQPGVFADGVIRCVAGNEIVFQSDAKCVRHPFEKTIEGKEHMVAFSKVSALAAASRDEEGTEFAFASINSEGSIETHSKLAFENSFSSWNILPDRLTFASIGEGGWREMNWRDGTRIGELLSIGTGKMVFAHEHQFGVAPAGWQIAAMCTSAYTGGRDYTVTLHQEERGRTISLGESSAVERGETPLVMLTSPGSDGRAVVLSSGHSRAELLSVDTESGQSSRLQAWEWNPSDGAPLYSEEKHWFFVPIPSGYEVFELSESGASEKKFTIAFEGEQGYVIALPEGQYAGSPGCESFHIFNAESGERVQTALIAPWHNQPATVLSVLGGTSGEIQALEKATERWLKRIEFHKKVEILDSHAWGVPYLIDRPKLIQNIPDLNFTLEVEAGNTAVGRVELRVNGVVAKNLIEERDPLPSESIHQLSTTIRLSEGQNWIEIQATDIKGLEGPIERFRVIYESSDTSGTRHIVTLGVSDYQSNEVPDLKFGVSDAAEISSLFENTSTREVRKLNLADTGVTRRALEEIRTFLASSEENDEIFVFFAGHGMLDKDFQYVFFTHDVSLSRMAETGITIDEILGILGSTKARKRILLMDTCQSGFVGERDELELGGDAEAVKREKFRFIEEMFRLPGGIRGINILGASRASEDALESPAIGGGFFTAAIREALEGGLGDLDLDGDVQVSELRDYLSTRVPEMTRSSEYPNGQVPSVVAFDPDQDFVVLGK